MSRAGKSLIAAALLGGFVTSCSAEAPAPAPFASAAPRPATAPAAEALDRLDGRRSVPLLPMMANHQKANMRDHLVAVQEVVVGAATEDYAAVERAAARIGFSESMGQMCSHMGTGAPGFAAQAVAFHKAADRIAAAARNRDRSAVLTELGATLQHCTACHEAWKQQVVDEETWERIAATRTPHSEAGDMAH